MNARKARIASRNHRLDPNDWDGAHLALVDAHRRRLHDLEQLDDQVNAAVAALAGLRKQLDNAREKLEQVDTMIAETDFKPPAGFDKFGDALPPTENAKRVDPILAS